MFEAVALHKNQSLIQDDSQVVTWHPNQPVDAVKYNRDYVSFARRADVNDPLHPRDYNPFVPTELANAAAFGDPPDQ